MAMTNQEIFDKVARHLLTQNGRSYGPMPHDPRVHGCLYRGPCGTKCAAGFLILDEHYSRDMEGSSVATGDAEGIIKGRKAILVALEKSGIGRESWALVRGLQLVHDGGAIHEWKHMLNAAAQRFGLSPAVLDEFPETTTA